MGKHHRYEYKYKGPDAYIAFQGAMPGDPVESWQLRKIWDTATHYAVPEDYFRGVLAGRWGVRIVCQLNKQAANRFAADLAAYGYMDGDTTYLGPRPR